ncbi:MAG: serine/threonine-protein kinase [Planctomycetaceae bacterium]
MGSEKNTPENGPDPTVPTPAPLSLPPSEPRTAETAALETSLELPKPLSEVKPRSDRFEATYVGSAQESPPLAVPVSRSEGRYETVRLIGRGGMGLVFLAKDRHLSEKFVALKRLNSDVAHKPEMKQRFLAEAAAMSKLTSIYTIRVIDSGSDQDGPFIAMEFVSGPQRTVPGWPPELPSPPLTLQEHIDTAGPVTVNDAVGVLSKICIALSEAHGHGYIHRDIKPGNILLDAHREPKLIDFGLARHLRPEESQHTQSGAKMLTAGYGAPEQESDARAAVEQSDIYALGAVLWFLTTGKNPRYYRPEDAPAQIRSVLSAALAAQIIDRPSNVSEFEKLLKAALTTGGRGSAEQKNSPVAQLMHLAEKLEAERVSGVCPVCQHRHEPIPTSPKVRQFCAGCGTGIWLKCQACESKAGLLKIGGTRTIPVWDRFCSKCGCDLIQPIATTLKTTASVLANANLASSVDVTKCHELATEAASDLTKLSAASGADFTRGSFGAICEVAKEEASRLLNFVLNSNQNADEQAWLAVMATPSVSAIDAYTAKFPNGRYILMALEEREYLLLREEIERRIKVKDLKGLATEVARLIQKSSKALSEWTDDRFSKLLARDTHPAACLLYLKHYPEGRFAERARKVVSPWLREQLLDEPMNRTVRTSYLQYRQETEEKEDVSRAYTLTMLGWVIAGCALSVTLFFLMKLPGVWLVSVFIGPFVVANMFAWINDSGRHFGPLPVMFYLVPHQMVPPTFRPLGDAK